MRPLVFPHPVTLEIEFKKPLQVLKARIRRQGWRYAGGLRLKTELGSMLDFRC